MEFAHRLSIVGHVLQNVTAIDNIERVVRKLNIGNIHLNVCRLDQIGCQVSGSNNMAKS